MTPVVPKPAASVVLVRPAPPTAPEPLEVYMIRRHRGMAFLGGYYAFPGGRVDPADGAPAMLGACHGLPAAGTVFPSDEEALAYPVPPLAYWVTAVRELVEETGLLLACDGRGRPVDAARADAAAGIERIRKALVAGEASFAELLGREGWAVDARPLRYLAHFITPTGSPIRFSARFFLCPLPPGQEPRLYTEETSEAFWIAPADGYRRFKAGTMAMAEPAEYGLGYVAQFDSLDDLLAAHADGGLKFHGIIDRIDVFWKDFDWQTNRFR
jgi:8-oxo-dGTP pyrophosphatase MutT (NUDIX family)